MESISHSQIQELVKQLPQDKLLRAYHLLQELADIKDGGSDQLDFMQRSLEERRRLLAEQAQEMKDEYQQTTENVRPGKAENSRMAISRSEVWLVNLEPTVGAEIRKTRPVVVINSDAVGTLPIRLVAPLTEWKEAFAGKIWLIKVEPDSSNNLSKTSAVDTLQLRGVDTSRFVQHLGSVSPEVMESIVAAVAAVIEYVS